MRVIVNWILLQLVQKGVINRWVVQQGLNTKAHLAVDAHGMLVRVMITQGTDADCQQALPLIAGSKASYFLADRWYDAQYILEQNKVESVLKTE